MPLNTGGGCLVEVLTPAWPGLSQDASFLVDTFVWDGLLCSYRFYCSMSTILHSLSCVSTCSAEAGL